MISENKIGATTNIDGNFSFSPNPGQVTLIISHIGYTTQTIKLDNTGNATIRIELAPNNTQLETVVVGGGENPAHRIILLMQQNNKKNNPDFKTSFKYNAYTVAAIGGSMSLFTQRANTDTVKKEKKVKKITERTEKQKKADSVNALIIKSFKQDYLMVTESYTERIFRFPGKSKEKI